VSKILFVDDHPLYREGLVHALSGHPLRAVVVAVSSGAQAVTALDADPTIELALVEHLVRYVGWYSNRARGERAKAQKTQDTPDPVPTRCALPIEPVSEPASAFAAHAKSAWARLIRKVYEADPLECPKCKGPMRSIALIDDPLVVRRILEHLGLWQPEAMERSPPVPPEAWPVNSVLPMTYHPVPDIA